MSFGHLYPDMLDVLAEVVRGRVVWDFGAGDLKHACQMLELGASKVVAVDKEFYSSAQSPKFEMIKSYFAHLQIPADGIDVAFLSWPRNGYVPGLLQLVKGASTVAYLGKNTDGSQCGDSLFPHLSKRQVLYHVPHRRNVFVVYGPLTPEKRPLLGEERAAMSAGIVTYEEAYGSQLVLLEERA